jgi:hypothetical protein
VPWFHENALLLFDGRGVAAAEDGAGCAAGDEQGADDRRQEPYRRTDAGRWIRRAARHCSYTPPTQSRSARPIVRSTEDDEVGMREIGETTSLVKSAATSAFVLARVGPVDGAWSLVVSLVPRAAA